MEQTTQENATVLTLYPMLLEYVSNCRTRLSALDVEIFRLIQNRQKNMLKIVERMEENNILDPQLDFSRRYEFIVNRAETITLLAMQYQDTVKCPQLLEAVNQGVRWLMEKETEIMSEINKYVHSTD